MIVYKNGSLVKGWFVGDFAPTCLRTNSCEVAVKEYSPGDYDAAHYHKVATEVTYILEGEVEMNGIRHRQGDIIVIEPNEVTDFRAVTRVINVVVKVPGQKDDKYSKET